MSITYGLTPQGFVKKTLAVIQAEIVDTLTTDFGSFINTLPESVFGQLIGIFSERESTQWDLMQAMYSAGSVNDASDASLDNAVAFNNIIRLAATPTKVSGVLLTGTPGAVLSAGKQAQVQITGATFSLDQDVTFDVNGNATGSFTGTATGPIQCPAGQLTIIATPATGWLTVSNPVDGVPGTNIETDDALKSRRLLSLENSVSGPIAAIALAVSQVSGVTQIVPFENFTNVVDANGLPPHSFEIYAFGGADADIEAAILKAKPAGIQPFGTTCGTVVDSEGQNQTICFARLLQVNVYMSVQLGVNTKYPSNGDTLVKEALVNYVDTLIGGQELVVSPTLISQLSGIPGLESAVIFVGTSASPTTSTNIQPARNQILRSDTSLVTVTHV